MSRKGGKDVAANLRHEFSMRPKRDSGVTLRSKHSLECNRNLTVVDSGLHSIVIEDMPGPSLHLMLTLFVGPTSSEIWTKSLDKDSGLGRGNEARSGRQSPSISYATAIGNTRLAMLGEMKSPRFFLPCQAIGDCICQVSSPCMLIWECKINLLFL